MANDENLKQIKVLTEDGLRVLFEQLGLGDYVTNSDLIGIINAIDEVKADKSQLPTKVSQLSNDAGYLTEVINISGNARSATKLTSNGGSSMQPVYFNNGVPTVCGFTVETVSDSEIDNIFSSGVISFTIKKPFGDGVLTLEAIEGMTWREWINSQYCTGIGYSFKEEDGVIYVKFDGGVYREVSYGNSAVSPTEEIVADRVYYDYFCCFDAGSKILMANGTTKNIEDVVIGDEVVSLNTETGEFITQKVKDTITNPRSTDLVYVNLSNGTRLAMRAYHPLLTTEGWKSLRPKLAETEMDVEEVQLLEIGDTLVGYKENAKVVSVDARPEVENYPTYNLSIDGYHNYIVDGIVAHNIACPRLS